MLIETNCNTCRCKLALKYVRYKDTNGSPYCQQCYITIGGIV